MGVTLQQLHVVLKDILAAIKASRSLGVIAGPKSSVSSLIPHLKDILAAVLPLDGNTDGIEGLLADLGKETTLASVLTALGPLATESTLGSVDTKATARNTSLSSIDSKASTRDGLLGTIDTDTGSIDTEISSLNGKFGILGSMGALILTIELTILAINARLTEGGFNLAELVTTIKAVIGTIDADTSAMNPNIAGINSFTASIRDNQDRDYGLRVWEYSETFTCTAIGTFIGVWSVPAFSTLSHLRFGTGAFPMLAATNYQWIVLNRATATIILPLGFLAMQAFISNQLNMGDLPMVVGALNDLQYGPRLGARALAVAESFTIMVRGSMSGGAAAPAVPVIGGTGTFTRVLNVNRVTNLDP